MDDLLYSAPCGFLTFADDGAILAVNALLLEMLQQDSSAALEMQGQHIDSVLSAGARIFYHTHLFPLLKLHGKAEEVYLALQPKSGESFPVLVNAARRERDGRFVNDCVIVPMRQRSRFEDEILRAKKAAEEATRAKEQAYAALAQANQELEEANVELEAQQEELRTQQEHLLELNAELRARIERETLLNRIGYILRSYSEPEAILNRSVTLLGEALGVDRCYFGEYDIARDRARVSADWHRPGLSSLSGTYRISDFDVDLTEVYGPEGLLQSQDILAADDVFSQKAAAALGALGMRSGVGVALFEGGVPAASLNVAMADEPRAWTKEEVELVQAVATLARSAVEEARLRQREHRIAEHLQAALQPPIPRAIPGLKIDAFYRPALQEASIGGDFYDVFPLHRGCYALVVADLSGKGLSAAAQIATVRHMLRAQLYQPGATPAHAIATLNEMLLEHELLSGFATLFAGAYDVHARTLTYVNAGQEPGLIRRSATAKIEEMGPTGPVLGGFPGATFQERTLPLGAGDVLALFTDGLTEAGPNRKDQLGMPGIIEIFRSSTQNLSPDMAQGNLLSPQEITAVMMQGVEEEATPGGIQDDVCLLVACVE